MVLLLPPIDPATLGKQTLPPWDDSISLSVNGQVSKTSPDPVSAS